MFLRNLLLRILTDSRYYLFGKVMVAIVALGLRGAELNGFETAIWKFGRNFAPPLLDAGTTGQLEFQVIGSRVSLAP